MVPFRATVLSLFSSKMNVAEKKIICKALLKQEMLSQPHIQNMAVVTCTTHLNDLVDLDSRTLFQLVGLPTTFLSESHQKRWLRMMTTSIAARS